VSRSAFKLTLKRRIPLFGRANKLTIPARFYHATLSPPLGPASELEQVIAPHVDRGG
jgi:hypothetical protein